MKNNWKRCIKNEGVCFKCKHDCKDYEKKECEDYKESIIKHLDINDNFILTFENGRIYLQQYNELNSMNFPIDDKVVKDFKEAVKILEDKQKNGW